MGTGIIPPTTGVVSPHPLLRGPDAALWLPETAEEWPGRRRLAGVSAMNADGVNVHVVLRSAPNRGLRYERMLRMLPRPARAGSGRRRAAAAGRARDRGRAPAVFLLHAPDRPQLAAALARLAGVARWLSEAELTDLSCQLIREARTQGRPGRPGGEPPRGAVRPGARGPRPAARAAATACSPPRRACSSPSTPAAA